MKARLLVFLAVFGTLFATAVALPSSASAVQYPQVGVVSENPVDYTPNVLNGTVYAVVQVGNTMIIGGDFSQVQPVGGATVTRNNIVAFNATTGALSTSFLPSINGQVSGLVAAPDGQSVYVGGSFTTVNGAASKSLARLQVSNGQATAGFSVPTINGVVREVRVSNNRLWIAGGFTKVGSVFQTGLAALNAGTGAMTSYMTLPITGLHQGGSIVVSRMDITPDGSRLVGIGNFTTVGGQPNEQVFMLDLTGGSAQLANWQTNYFVPQCNPSFNTYMRDLDFSPDGSYFVLTTTGAYGGSTSPCDSITRWETGASGTDVQPSWADLPGGDTSYAVAITNTAVYVGGHQRWMNNPFAGDAPGPGAVAREGIAALDPTNGLPLSWNPGRTRGVGVQDLLATPTGLWVASDTDRIGHYEYHGRIAFFPLAGGTQVTTPATGSLPGKVYLAGRRSAPVSSNVLYRVNAGGQQLPSLDSGPAWAADTNAAPDPHHNAGSNDSDWGTAVGSVDASVPSTTPPGVFTSERWSPGSPEMHWGFDAATGKHLRVNLYFANRCSCTSTPGARVFNVAIDGAPELTNYDIVADAEDNKGTVKSFDVTSDGTVDIDFSHVNENPLINGIEIIDLDAPAPPPPGRVLYRVDAGGQALLATDDGPDWAEDSSSNPSPYHNGGNNSADYGGPAGALDPSVPDSTPLGLFGTELWSPGNPEMQWTFPAQVGQHLQVRLYFANRCSCTSAAGSRKFSVAIDGVTKLSAYDIVADVGDNTGVMKSYDITSDGAVNIDFSHVVENPLVNGIEIINLDAPTGGTSANDDLRSVNFTGTAASSLTTVAGGSIPWHSARGTVMLNGVLYYGLSDGNFYGRTYNGTSFGAAFDVNTQDAITPLGAWHSDVQNMTGLAYADGRLYYTLSGDNHLYYRYFLPESRVVGAARFVADNGSADHAWSSTTGMFASGGRLYWASTTDGGLRRATLSASGDVGASSLVSGPSQDGVDWRARSLFLYSGANQAPPNNPPTAVATVNCTGLSCTASSTGSADGDGSITGYSWAWGDGATSTTPTASHTYAGNGGTFTVTLTVTDDDSATGTDTKTVTVTKPNAPPTAAFSASCSARLCSFNGSGSSDDGSIASYKWTFGDGDTQTTASATTSHTYAADDAYTVQLLVTDNQGATDSVSHTVSVAATPQIARRAVATPVNVNATKATLTIPAAVQAGDALVLFGAVNSTAVTLSDPTGVTGWTEIDNGTGSFGTRVWRKTATAADAGAGVSVSVGATAKITLQLAAYSGVDTAQPVADHAVVQEPGTSVNHASGAVTAVAGSTVLTWWVDKSSTTTTWTTPAAVHSLATSIGSGTGRMTSTLVDSDGAVSSGAYGPYTATTDAASRGQSYTVALRPAS